MDGSMTEQTAIREVVAIFGNREALENAIEDLLSNGFDRSQLSLLASHDAVEETLGHAPGDVHAIAEDPEAPRSEPLERPDVGNLTGVAVGPPAAFAALAAAGLTAMTGGAFAGVAVAALAAGGGVGALGAFLAKRYTDEVEDDFEEQVARGGIVMWINLREPHQEERAREILARHSKEKVWTHKVTGRYEPRS
jgi:hypothetical protein